MWSFSGTWNGNGGDRISKQKSETGAVHAGLGAVNDKQHRQQEYSRMNPQDNTRTWQLLTLSLIIVMALATVYLVAVVGGA